MSALLMATRGCGTDAEAEPVIVELHGHLLVFDLDDGDQLVLDFDELLAAVNLGQGRDRSDKRPCPENAPFPPTVDTP